VGLRTCHVAQVLEQRPAVPWFELLADNHLAAGGAAVAQAEAVGAFYPVTLHCVGMNLAGVDPLDRAYLERVCSLRDRTEAAWVSDHLCFTALGGRHYHDLLPFPYTTEALRHVAARVLEVQDLLGEPLVVENVSSYLRFVDAPLGEAQFLAELVRATGCFLLLDVNNLYVNHRNHGDDLEAYLAALPLDRVREIHLAGYEAKGGYLLDAHNHPVSAPVWELYGRVCRDLAQVPALIEWDNEIPAFEALAAEAGRAERVAAAARRGQAARTAP
jgi:uncharacterized protein (UPF0276 family)